MKRRGVIALVGGVAALPPTALAPQPPRVGEGGVLTSRREDDIEAQTRASILRKGLGALGWTEGDNIQIDYRWAGGDAARARVYAAELVRLAPDVIIANSTLCLKAVRNETSMIP